MKRLLSLLTVFVILISLYPRVCASEESLTFVSFGSYPQTEVEPTDELAQAEYDENGDTELNGMRYRRLQDWDGTIRYFRWEPIIWQLVGNMLLARDVIDCKMYDEQEYRETGFGGGTSYCDPVPWEESSLCEFLTEDFRTLAFSEEEQVFLTNNATLFTVDQANFLSEAGISHAYLPKSATDYACVAGVNVRSSQYYDGDSEWLLKDISPIISSAVCTISRAGKINTGMTVLLNEAGMGLVPCIQVTDWHSLSWWTEPMPEAKIKVYFPGGLIDVVSPEKADKLVAQGWYLTEAEAKAVSLASMEERFAASRISQECDWSVDNRNAELDIRPNQLNMSPLEAVEYINRIVNTFFTGEIGDYIHLRTYLGYDASFGDNLSQFAENIGYEVHDVLKTAFTYWGALVTVGQYAAGTTSRPGCDFELRIDLELNGNGTYSESFSQYYQTMTALVQEAKAYSDRPLGQLQFIRNYFGQNTVYDANLYNNNPILLTTEGIGICGSYASFVNDFCAMANIPCMYLSCNHPNHGWNAVYLEGRWHMIDTTGSKSRNYMRSSYSRFSADGISYSFDPSGFPEEVTAENVDFLFDQHYMLDHPFATEECCSVTEEQYQYLQELLKPHASDYFTDVPIGSFYDDPVLWAVENGITNGATADTFNPGGECMRAHVVTFLWRAAGQPEPTSTVNPFEDVKESDFYYKAVLWAVENGITNGADASHFNPLGICNRAQVVTFLHRAFGSPAVENAANPFTDVESGTWYASPVLWAVASGITNGLSADSFGPNSPCNRAQVVTFLYRAYN